MLLQFRKLKSISFQDFTQLSINSVLKDDLVHKKFPYHTKRLGDERQRQEEGFNITWRVVRSLSRWLCAIAYRVTWVNPSEVEIVTSPSICINATKLINS